MTFNELHRQDLKKHIGPELIEKLADIVNHAKENGIERKKPISKKQWADEAERIDSLAADLQKLMLESSLVQRGYLGNAWDINRPGEATANDWGSLFAPGPAAADLVSRLSELRALCRNAAEVISNADKAAGEFTGARAGPSAETVFGFGVLATLSTNGVKVSLSESGTAACVLRVVMDAAGVEGDAFAMVRAYKSFMKLEAIDC